MGYRHTIRRIAIIGGGPKGLYGFERLTAWLNLYPPPERTEIHIFNRSPSFGAGDIYRTDQPSYLLMNNPVGEINMWGKQGPSPVVPGPLSLPDWLRQTMGLDVSDHDYTSRAMAGRYLSQGFKSIAANLPPNVHGTYVVGEVIDISRESGRYSLRLQTQENPGCHSPDEQYDHVLLATGHPKHGKTKQALRFQRFAETHEDAGFIPFVYPAETAFSDVPPGCSVGMLGIGLTFVDAVLALTEGKGGRFQRSESAEELVYSPSGEEPRVIYPFSRTGLPMIPRISVPTGNNELRFLTPSALQRLDSRKQLDFDRQIWPLLQQDMIYAYYRIALKNARFPTPLSGCNTFEDVERLIGHFHQRHPCEPPFNAEAFLRPARGAGRHAGSSHNEWIKSLYKGYLEEARKGELLSPLAAAVAVWRKASPLFSKAYAFGGFAPKSHQQFDASSRGMLDRVTFGPALKSAEKLYALMQYGLLDFDLAENPDVVPSEELGTFVLQHKETTCRRSVQYLVDARIPKVRLADHPGPLYRNLLDRGLITIYENRAGQDVYRPGAVNITRQGCVIGRDGHINQSITVAGTPTEGITFDNDALSRDRNNFVDDWAEFICREYSESAREHYAN